MKSFFIFLLFMCSGAFSQNYLSEFDAKNLYEYEIYKRDSGVAKNNIQSITKYEISADLKKRKTLYEKYLDGFLLEYERYFENYDNIMSGKIRESSSKGFTVEYCIPKSGYQADSSLLFIDCGVISKRYYDSLPELDLRIEYAETSDTTYEIQDFLNGTKIGERRTLFNPNPKFFQPYMEHETFVERRGDTIITRTERTEFGRKSVSIKYRTFFDKPIKEEGAVYTGDSVSDVGRIIRKYDRKKRMVYYSVEVEDRKKMRMVTRTTTKYDALGNYTISECINFVMKPYLVTDYNKKGQVLNDKMYNYIRHTIGEGRYSYNKRGLLEKINYYKNGKWDHRETFEYTFN